MLVLGVIFLTVLVADVADRNDNPYLHIGLLGRFLVVAGGVFALAAVLPHPSPRTWVVRGGIVALWVVLVPSLGLLVPRLAFLLLPLVIPLQTYDPLVFIRHLMAVVAIVATLYVVGYRLARSAD